MEGKILSTVGGIYKVYSNGNTYSLFSRGSIKHKSFSLCAGDNISFDEKENIIEKAFDRKNFLIRPRSANVDLMVITMSVVEPELSPELVYKFLTYANLNSIPAAVLFTKMDKLNNFEKVETLKSDLEKLGYKVFLLSKENSENIKEIQDFLAGKTTIIMGQTGVGKSTAINLIDPHFNRKIGEYSEALGRGKHQTKEVILLPFKNGFIGDTPGFSSLELDLYKEDLAQYFPGYEKYYLECYFSNCLHQKEKECKIKEEIDKGNLSKEGYEVYIKLLNQLDFRSQRYKK
jgi:ribosome biogenesis GTPase